MARVWRGIFLHWTVTCARNHRFGRYTYSESVVNLCGCGDKGPFSVIWLARSGWYLGLFPKRFI